MKKYRVVKNFWNGKTAKEISVKNSDIDLEDKRAKELIFLGYVEEIKESSELKSNKK